MDAHSAERRGTVFIVIESADVAATPRRHVFGYWDGAPDDDAEGFLEALPDALTPEAAIDWARRRSARVLIRNDDPTFPLPTGRYLWAGDAACPPDVQPMP
ncbi:MAG: hypothetical protein ACLGHQ_04660 [Acidimicrobiia bacterium]